MELERILIGTNATLGQTFYEDGVAVDPGAVTVTVTRWNGTVISTGSATGGSGTSERTFNLTAATYTNLLDRLRVDFVSATKGTLTAYVEVVGGFLFTLSELSALKPGNLTWTTAQMADMRTLVEQAFEDVADVAFVPRYYMETFSGTGSTRATLRWTKVRTVRSATVEGTVVSPASDVIVLREGIGYLATGWTTGYGNVTVGYEYGWDVPPARIKRAALFEARFRLIQANSPTDDRAVRLDTDVGSYALQQPGRGGMNFYLPESDAAVEQYSMSVGVL